MFRQITGTIGNMMKNFEGDVLQVKSALERLGRFDFASKPEPHGYVTKELDGSIREYQRDRGLKIDGWMRPGGETERSLSRDLRDMARTPPFVPVSPTSRSLPRTEFRPFAGINVNLDKISTGINNLKQASDQKPTPDAKTKPSEPYGPPAPEKKSESSHTIDTFFSRIQKDEGGYAQIDPAGPTKIGINAGTLWEYEGFKKSKGEALPGTFTKDIKKVTPELARQIYDEMYFKRYNLDKISDERTAAHLLDIAINPGPARAGTWLQQELSNHLGINIKVDGVIGPQTRALIEEAKKKGVLNEVNNGIARKRLQHYEDQAQKPGFERYSDGWHDRARSYILPPIPKRKPMK